MEIIEIMKIIDEKEMQKKKKKKRQKQSYKERVRAKWFCYAFKLGFLQLMCKSSLIFKSNFELALYKSKHLRWSVYV